MLNLQYSKHLIVGRCVYLILNIALKYFGYSSEGIRLGLPCSGPGVGRKTQVASGLAGFVNENARGIMDYGFSEVCVLLSGLNAFSLQRTDL